MKKIFLISAMVIVFGSLAIAESYDYSEEQKAIENLLDNNTGKSPDFLIKVWGQPEKVNRSSIEGVKEEQIIWTRNLDVRGRHKITIYVYTKNGLITSWQTRR